MQWGWEESVIRVRWSWGCNGDAMGLGLQLGCSGVRRVQWGRGCNRGAVGLGGCNGAGRIQW